MEAVPGALGSPILGTSSDSLSVLGASNFDQSIGSSSFAQNWLRVTAHARSSGEDMLMAGFGAPSERGMGSSEDLEEIDPNQITVDGIVRRFLRQEADKGRNWVDGEQESGGGGSGESGGDLGLNLVREVLVYQMDKELALNALNHTTEIREYLLKMTAVDQASGFEILVTGSGRKSAAGGGSKSSGTMNSTLSSAELERIKQVNQGTSVGSLMDFISKTLIDIRLIFFFAISVVAILLFTMLVSRWVKA